MLITALILAAGVLLATATARASAGPPVRAAAIQRLLVVGDSLTTSRYWQWLQLPGVPRTAINGQGWGGQQPLFIAQHAQPLLVQYQPTDVVALFGVNEVATRVVQAHGRANVARITAAITQDLTTAWALLRARGARVWALTLTPWFGYAKYFGPDAADAAAMRQVTRAVNAWIKAQAGQPGGPDHVIDTASLGDAQGRLRQRYSHDNLHMNGTGYRALATLVQAALLNPNPSAPPNRSGGPG